MHMFLYRGRESKGVRGKRERGKQNLWDLMQLPIAGAESQNPQFSARRFGASICRRVDVGLSGLARCYPSLEWKMNTPRNGTTATATATGPALVPTASESTTSKMIRIVAFSFQSALVAQAYNGSWDWKRMGKAHSKHMLCTISSWLQD